MLFKTSTSLFGSQANSITESARMVYTVNDPLCETDGELSFRSLSISVPENLAECHQCQSSQSIVHMTFLFSFFTTSPGHRRCAGNYPLPDTVDVWRANNNTHRIKRLLSFGVAPLPESCSKYTVLQNVYGARGRMVTIGQAEESSQ